LVQNESPDSLRGSECIVLVIQRVYNFITRVFSETPRFWRCFKICEWFSSGVKEYAAYCRMENIAPEFLSYLRGQRWGTVVISRTRGYQLRGRPSCIEY
jgi:hypothetical protein